MLDNSKRLLYTAFMKSQTEAASMICSACEVECRRFGKHRNGLQRFRCPECGRTYTEEHEKPLGSMTVPMGKAVLALRLLLEGSSVRTVERITDLHRDTICKLLTVAGEKCEKIMAEKVRNIPVRDENHWAAVMVWYTYYNFCRIHRSLRVTPAMEANVSDHVWTIRELLEFPAV